MIKLDINTAQTLMNTNQFGHSCEHGAFIGSKEFTIWIENDNYFLVHKSEIKEEGLFVKLNEKIESNITNLSKEMATYIHHVIYECDDNEIIEKILAQYIEKNIRKKD